jgi:WhiB family transcriptional regulator, redox-sensing transcriptional regulator
MTHVEQLSNTTENSAVTQTVEPSYEEKLERFWAGTELRKHDWSDDAACKDVSNPDAIFHPETGKGKYKTPYIDARLMCGSCAVRNECLNDALLADNVPGIQGGLSEHELKKLKTRIRKNPYNARMWAEEKREEGYTFAVHAKAKQLKAEQKANRAS